MLYHIMPCDILLYYTIPYYTILYYTILYSTLLYSTLLYSTLLYYTILYYTILFGSVDPLGIWSAPQLEERRCGEAALGGAAARTAAQVLRKRAMVKISHGIVE